MPDFFEASCNGTQQKKQDEKYFIPELLWWILNPRKKKSSLGKLSPPGRRSELRYVNAGYNPTSQSRFIRTMLGFIGVSGNRAAESPWKENDACVDAVREPSTSELL